MLHMAPRSFRTDTNPAFILSAWLLHLGSGQKKELKKRRKKKERRRGHTKLVRQNVGVIPNIEHQSLSSMPPIITTGMELGGKEMKINAITEDVLNNTTYLVHLHLFIIHKYIGKYIK